MSTTIVIKTPEHSTSRVNARIWCREHFGADFARWAVTEHRISTPMTFEKFILSKYWFVSASDAVLFSLKWK